MTRGSKPRSKWKGEMYTNTQRLAVPTHFGDGYGTSMMCSLGLPNLFSTFQAPPYCRFCAFRASWRASSSRSYYQSMLSAAALSEQSNGRDAIEKLLFFSFFPLSNLQTGGPNFSKNPLGSDFSDFPISLHISTHLGSHIWTQARPSREMNSFQEASMEHELAGC